ncbi:ADP-forming succinate--CoA ligase subunit beta [Candidatus Finniella inopinata]|uniref:Succinate--CoA ligase [ADP-forming] subunit beta n=1 Tax=Candidatus Finniella inopinata TaxID=1696036 RepID=A0A4Q7DJC7_9PROT|nr:ADP-forming succinate--CoA ligase subunit beta [Candidatus Finniella inopinata]RZI46450.1 ADP-forming succinate--CoA ligase subunit beta [Candidatus Finniella inopinata]
MNLHEYQAKQILADFGVPILFGKVAYTPDQAVEVAQTLGGDLWVVKAQIHAGGRGKAGGVLLAHSLAEVKDSAHTLLNRSLVTAQTGPQGELVECVYVEQGCAIERELYVSLSLNRRAGQLCLVASASGGVAIEEVAHKNPEAIDQILIDPFLGIQPYHLQRLGKSLSLPTDILEPFLKSLYQAYIQFDASLIEINPLAATKQGKLVALDAKMAIDDNAAYRQPFIKEWERTNPLPAEEQKAQDYGLSYVKLYGDIACMVNGAGLAMATLDLIQGHGGKPANFLDIGGSADQERVEVAFQLITADPKVKVVFINIFGGIIQCDMIANSIVAAAQQKAFDRPIVVRLEGAHSVEARQILATSGLAIVPVSNLEEAAQEIMRATKEHP